MTNRTRKCRRCGGTGFVDTAAMHRGVPGLCMCCDGNGCIRVRSAEEIAAAKIAGEFSARASAARATLRAAIATLQTLSDQWAAEDAVMALEANDPARFAQMVASVEAGRTSAVVQHLITYAPPSAR